MPPNLPVTLSVIARPDANGAGVPYGDFVISMASVADEMPAWGTSPAARDRALRAFWPTEPILASAIFSTAARYAAFGYTLEGPTRTVNQIDDMINGCEAGAGWEALIMKLLLDIFGCDNGGFLEFVREEDNPRAPVISMNVLDSLRCWRTGDPLNPVIYYDMRGNAHKLKWWNVAPITEMPSPDERVRGLSYCTVTRLLRSAQIMRDISVYYREKISGRFTRAIHFVSGIQNSTIKDAVAKFGIDNDTEGLARYVQPLIIGSLDPTANVSVATILMAGLPDGFNYEEFMRWNINQLALAFGGDYQDYAPLPGGNLGSSQQSQVLATKSRGKGPRLFMKIIERVMNYMGALPRNVQFKYGDQDISEDLDHTKLAAMRADERAVRIKSGEITVEVARQIAVDYGDLDARYLPLLAKAGNDASTGVNASAGAGTATGDVTPDNPPVTSDDVAGSGAGGGNQPRQT